MKLLQNVQRIQIPGEDLMSFLSENDWIHEIIQVIKIFDEIGIQWLEFSHCFFWVSVFSLLKLTEVSIIMSRKVWNELMDIGVFQALL